jgi:hypothetical protein
VFTQQGAARAGGVGAAAIGGGLEIWCAPVDGSSEARLLVQTPGSAWGACVSPDNKVIAFVSDESGRAEVYVQPYPGPGPRRVVSTEGGSAPLFAKHGGELYYRTSAGTVASVGGAGGMMPGPTGGAGQGAVGGVSGAGALPAGTEQIVAVRVTMEPFAVSRPRVLFQGNAVPASQAARNYDLLLWGGGEAALQMALQHFVILRSQESAAKVTSLGVTLNWFTELRRRIPVPQAPTLSSLRPGSSHFAVGGMSGSSAAPTRTQGGWGGGTYATQGQHPPQPHPQQGATQAPNAPPPPQRNWSHDSKTIG